ncbi:hypothetical protein QFC22_003397 [Naganishia vaughanmartiniae]|uniref:Uncharacterized protein n=1 Tax=Naganishia vaughanmartiniae TaxID=1424756 RepID=A0ACC2XA73_9TREE|nr:hypothetical protein QFC22_003397 [Naganishia vaughanmartiniae]
MPRAIVQHTPLAIRLTEPITYLRATGEDARGRPLQARSDEPPAVIRGLLTLKLTKPSRIRRIEVKIEGKARTEWPEGIGPRRTETSEEHIFISETLTFFTAAQSHSRSRDRRAVSLGPGSRIDEDWGLDEEDEMSEGEVHEGHDDAGRGRTGRESAREVDERGRTVFGRGQMRSFSAIPDGPRPPFNHTQTQPPTRRQSFDRDISSVLHSPMEEAPGFVLDGGSRRTSFGDYSNNTPRQPARNETLYRQRGPSPAYSFRDPLRSSSAFHPRTTTLRQEAEDGQPQGRPAGGYHYASDEADLAEASLSPIASVDPSAESSRWASPERRESTINAPFAHGTPGSRPSSPGRRPTAAQPLPPLSPPASHLPASEASDGSVSAPHSLSTPRGSISTLPEGSPSNSAARQSISSPDINYISVTRPGSRQSIMVEQIPSPHHSPILGPHHGHRDRASREGSFSSLIHPPLLHLGSRRPSTTHPGANMHSASASQTSVTGQTLGLHEPTASSSSSSLATATTAGERGRKPSKFSFAAVTNSLRNLSKSGTGSRSRSGAPPSASSGTSVPPVPRGASVITDGRLRRLADENEEFRPFGRGGAGRSPSRSGRGTSASRAADERSESRSRGRHIGLKVLTGALKGDDDDDEGVHNWKEFRKGTYNYPISFSVPASCPPTIHADFGSVVYRLKATVVRVGALSPNFTEEQEVALIASPGEDDLEETENVIVERQWEDQLRYLVALSGKAFPIGGQIPMSLRFMPMSKCKIYRLSATIEGVCTCLLVLYLFVNRIFLLAEKIDYFALDKRVARHEAVKRYPLMALKHDSKPPEPLLPILSESTEAIWTSPLAAFAVQAMTGNDTEDDAVASLLNPVGPWYLDTTLQVPDCSSRIRFTTKHAKTNMAISHWLKLIIRVERGDDVAVDAKGRRKQFDIIIETPLHLLDCRSNSQWNSLPTYLPDSLPTAANTAVHCRIHNGRGAIGQVPLELSPGLINSTTVTRATSNTRGARYSPSPAPGGTTRSLSAVRTASDRGSSLGGDHSETVEVPDTLLERNIVFDRLVSGQETEAGEAPPTYDEVLQHEVRETRSRSRSNQPRTGSRSRLGVEQ